MAALTPASIRHTLHKRSSIGIAYGRRCGGVWGSTIDSATVMLWSTFHYHLIIFSLITWVCCGLNSIATGPERPPKPSSCIIPAPLCAPASKYWVAALPLAIIGRFTLHCSKNNGWYFILKFWTFWLTSGRRAAAHHIAKRLINESLTWTKFVSLVAASLAAVEVELGSGCCSFVLKSGSCVQ